MKERDGVFDLTWKEAMEAFPREFYPYPWWFRLLAPAQHWFACTFLGHTAVNVNTDFSGRRIPGTGAPKWQSENLLPGAVLVDRLP